MTFYFCDACRYCFESASMPDRCPDCGKTENKGQLSVRLATEKEIQDLLRARNEDWD